VDIPLFNLKLDALYNRLSRKKMVMAFSAGFLFLRRKGIYRLKGDRSNSKRTCVLIGDSLTLFMVVYRSDYHFVCRATNDVFYENTLENAVKFRKIGI